MISFNFDRCEIFVNGELELRYSRRCLGEPGTSLLRSDREFIRATLLPILLQRR
jgi:hypothetical protein